MGLGMEWTHYKLWGTTDLGMNLIFYWFVRERTFAFKKKIFERENNHYHQNNLFSTKQTIISKKYSPYHQTLAYFPWNKHKTTKKMEKQELGEHYSPSKMCLIVIHEDSSSSLIGAPSRSFNAARWSPKPYCLKEGNK